MKYIIPILFGVLCTQLPRYIELYVHVAKGASLEAQRTVVLLELQAAKSNKTLSEYIRKHLNAPDTDFQNTGQVMVEALEHSKEYHLFLDKMSSAQVWEKPFILAKYFNLEIANAVDFEPALYLTRESSIYGLAGFLSFLLIIPFFRWLIGHAFSLSRKRKEISRK